MDPLTDGQLSVRKNTNDSHFPPELVDQVLRELDPSNLFDSRTLRTCALVSRTWLRLSRAVLFSSIILIPYNNNKGLKALTATTIRPYVRDIEVAIHPPDTKTHLTPLLAQFPELTTLRLVTDPIESATLIIALQVQDRFARQQERERNAGVHRADTSRLFRGRHIVIRVEEPTTKPSPFVIPEHVPLSTLRTVHLAYPMHNAQVLALLSPRALDALHLTLRESDPDAVHISLRAAGTSLRVLVVDFPNDLRIGHTTTALHTTLRVLRLRALHQPLEIPPIYMNPPSYMSRSGVISAAARILEDVLTAPNLEELIIESEVPDEDAMDGVQKDTAQAELDRVLGTLPMFKTLRLSL